MAAWLELAADEDEAVEAFRVHVQELISLGAPDSLVERARQARDDEARHRDLALQVASELAGRPHRLGPRILPATPHTDRMSILIGVARGGALNETLSMALLLAEAEVSRHRTVLHSIAEDEARHSALAWDTLHWAWPSLTDSERTALIDAIREPLELRSPLGGLTHSRLHTLKRTVRDRVVEPLVQHLHQTSSERFAEGGRLCEGQVLTSAI